jgi:excisionase family DNA binding protein
MPETAERPLGLQEAAAFLSTSPTTLRFWVARGMIAHSRLGRRLLFLPSDLQRLVAARRVPATTDRAAVGPAEGPAAPNGAPPLV